MKRFKKFASGLLILAMLISLCSCNEGKNGKDVNPDESKQETDVSTDATTETSETTEPLPTPTPTVFVPTPTDSPNTDPMEFTMYSSYPGKEKSEKNEIMSLIEEKTGVKVKESWLTGQDPNTNIDDMTYSGEFPDFINTSVNRRLYESGRLIAWDGYINKYPNIKAMYTDAQWDKFRQEDGHIYWANCSGSCYQENTDPNHNGFAFWIQVRVLEAYGYPKIETLDQYFDLIEKFAKEYPELPNGTKVIPYTVLCEDWKYYCLEAAPLFLDGYPNNGCVGVNLEQGIDNPKVVDYNVSETAKAYFKKLNEEYKKGVIDPEYIDMTYDQYMEKINTGAVLGFSDQYWNFGYSISYSFQYGQQGPNGKTIVPSDLGCDYVPLGLTMKPGMKQQYHDYSMDIDYSSGIAVTTSCKDPDRAFKFLNDLLSQEIHDLRFWGVEGKDYLVDDQGLFYRTDKMRAQWNKPDYQTKHVCQYSYMPQFSGMSRDGKNRMMPEHQPSEFKTTLPKCVVKCFEAYNVGTYSEFIGSEKADYGRWYPLWSWSNNLGSGDYDGAGDAWQAIMKCKKSSLPGLVKAQDFDSAWKTYEKDYNDCNPQAFLKGAQKVIRERMR